MYSKPWGLLKNRLIFSIIVFFVVLSFFLININPTYSWDEIVYISMAEGLLNGGGYGWVGGSYNDAFRAPLTSILIFLISFIWGSPEIVSKLLILIFSASSIFLVYLLGKKAMDKKFGLLAALAITTNHLFVFFSHRILPENILGFILTAQVLFFWISIKNKKFILPLSALLALGFLTRYTALLIIIPFILYLYLYKKHMEFIKSKYTVLSVALFLLLISPWALFSQNVYGNPLGTILQLKSSFGLVNPYSIFLYFIFAPGFLLPFFFLGVYRGLKERNRFLILLCLVIATFLPLQNFAAEGLRYFAPFVGIFSIISVYKLKEKFVPIFFILCILNAAVGYYVISKYAFPSEKTDIFLSLSTFSDYYTKHSQYKESGNFLRDATSNDETVMTDAYAYSWFYSRKNFVEIPKSQTEFYSLVKKYNIRYLFSTQSNNVDFVKIQEVVFNREFVKIYKITE